MADEALKLVRPVDMAGARRGIACLMGGPEGPARNEANTVARAENFIAYASQASLDLRRQVQALGPAGELVGMCLWVPSPGRTALVFTCNLVESPHAAASCTACVQAALADAQAAGVQLVQGMVEPSDTLLRDVFVHAGLTFLATLNYMERRPPLIVPTVALPDGFSLEAYTPANHEQFKAAISASYRDTLDCPGLSGLRDMEDVIVGHKAVGPFEPELWSLVKEHGVARGVLLLGELPARNALELVYLGLAPEARGRGLGKALMNRVLAIGSRRAFGLLTLAVDAANVPAAKMYRRFGYARVAERAAYIRKLG